MREDGLLWVVINFDKFRSVRLSQVLPTLGPNDVCLSILPYFHAGGLLTAFVMLVQGVRLIVWSQFEREKFVEIILRYNVTVLSIVPAILDGIIRLGTLPEDMTKVLRYIFVGGDRLKAEQVQAMERLLTPKQQLIQC